MFIRVHSNVLFFCSEAVILERVEVATWPSIFEYSESYVSIYTNISSLHQSSKEGVLHLVVTNQEEN